MLSLNIAGGCVVNLGFIQPTTTPSIIASGDIQTTLVNLGPFGSICFLVTFFFFFFPLSMSFYSIVGINHKVSVYDNFKLLCNCRN